jgi:hypothetical protein
MDKLRTVKANNWEDHFLDKFNFEIETMYKAGFKRGEFIIYV